MTARSRSGVGLARKEQRDGRDRKDHADDCESVAKADNEGLPLDDVADGNDRLMLRCRWIGDAVRQEIVRQVGDALAHLIAIGRHRLAMMFEWNCSRWVRMVAS